MPPEAPRERSLRGHGPCRGALEAAGVLAGFLAFGLAWAALEPRAARSAPAYSRAAMDEGAELAAGRVWLIDGFNVLHAGVLRGRDRARWWAQERRDQLLARAAGFDDPDSELWVVFDGPRPPEAPAATGRVRPVFAASADDWLVARVRESPRPERLAVVTADRQLAARVRHRGARVVSPSAFLARCRPPGQ
jgi:hypothetical protein